MMLVEFICELERVLPKWPENTSWTLAQIADYTSTGVPQVVDFLSDTLDRELEVHEAITQAEGAKAFAILKDRMADELLARQKRLEQRRDKAMRAYDLTMDKVRALLVTKNWRSAYKTLSYYVGCHEKDLASELLLNLCGECLRLGFKSDANLQELSQWLRKGVAACLNSGSVAGIEDALDFLDAHGEQFINDDPSERGRRLIGNVLDSLKSQATTPDLAQRYAVLVKDLRIA